MSGNLTALECESHAAPSARRITVTGHVQGVGFRPFVYRLAQRSGLAGRVWNALGAVEIEVQGSAAAIDRFSAALLAESPPMARPQVARSEPLAVDAARQEFRIDSSAAIGTPQIFVPADQFCCDECLAELTDPRNRRYRYPFINCTQCGPRYTLIERLPYDRPNTTMAPFALCTDCEREYRDPLDRRYHAEPIACPVCGPQLTLTGRGGEIRRGEAALDDCVQRLCAGEIVAVKGIGGYHLLCDALSEAAVRRLRERKHRPNKPFAVLYPRCGADGLAAMRDDVELDATETALLRDPARPIVLVTRRAGSRLAAGIAPGLAEIGVFLPYSPLHQLLLEGCARPLVATSGNISGEPVIIDAAAAEQRLGDIADAFLHHDRPIVRPADDSVWRRSAGALRPIRLGRGQAPLELELPQPLASPVLALGAQLKNCIALAWQRRVVISPHIGTLDSPRSLEVFVQVGADLQRLYGVNAQALVADAHDGYANSRWARRSGLPVTRIWHHHAHAAALVGEYGVRARTLIFCWDGLGLGEDGALWGGETLLGMPGDWQRVASLREFRLPGGDRAAREPWRMAASLCWHTDTAWPELPPNSELLRAAWERGLACPWTTSAGRLFDAAAALVLGIHTASYEAQAPMQLEASAGVAAEPVALVWRADARGLLRLDWAPLLPMLIDKTRTAADRAACFHESLAAAIVDLAEHLKTSERFAAVGLTGGVFQNRRLVEAIARRLSMVGLRLLLPQRLPANDAAICFGQALELAARQQACAC